MSKSLKRVRAALEAAGAPVEILEMAGETRTAAQAAEQAGCQIDQIAKSIIFAGAQSHRLYLFLTPGGRQVDPARAADLAGEALERADANQVRELTGFAIGGVAPVGHLTAPRAFLDSLLLTYPVVWAAAGTPRHVFAIDPALLTQISGAQAADFITASEKM